jgi:hypothetical protein
VFVRGGAEVDERIDVSDSNADPDGAVRYSLRDFDLIEVAGFAIVDRRPRLATHVPHARRQGIVGWIVE